MAENAKDQLLRDLAAETTDAELRQIAQDHIVATQSQVDRVSAQILALDGDKSEPKGFLNSFLAKASNAVNIFHSKEDKQAQNTIKAFAFEHFEIGAYTSLHAYAAAIGDTETATLAETIIGEEKIAADKFLRLIPQLAVASVGNAADV